MGFGPQDLAVGVVAVAGAFALGRKVWRMIRPTADDAGCPNCASGTGCPPNSHDLARR